MEPGFYMCECGRRWHRMEAKLSANPPKKCPLCGAGDDKQKVDTEAEESYISRVYAPAAEAIFGKGNKDDA
jgi:hypothetical protein